jgi:hypothetical protein
MIIKLKQAVQIKLRRPIVFFTKQKYELTFYLPIGTSSLPLTLFDGYWIRVVTESDKDALLQLYQKCGFEFTPASLTSFSKSVWTIGRTLSQFSLRLWIWITPIIIVVVTTNLIIWG